VQAGSYFAKLPSSDLTELAEDIRPAIGRQPARKTNGMADIEPTFPWEVDSIPQRQREPDVQHHRQADDLVRRFEALECEACRHPKTLSSALACLKQSSPDRARLVITGRYLAPCPASSEVLLTKPN